MRSGIREVEVRQVRKLLASGVSVAEVARQFQVPEQCIKSHVVAPAPAPAPESGNFIKNVLPGRKR